MTDRLASNLKLATGRPSAFADVYAVMAPKLLAYFARRTAAPRPGGHRP